MLRRGRRRRTTNTFGSATSVVPFNETCPLLLPPLQKLARFVECRRNGAPLNKAVLDGQPTPTIKDLLLNTVRAFSPLSNRNAPFEPARYARLSSYHNIALARFGFANVGIFVP